jgi:hypothetical protein
MPTKSNVGAPVSFTVTLTNQGAETWKASGTNNVRLGVLLGASGGATNDEWLLDYRVTLPNDVAPGASVNVPVAVRLPDTAGTCVVRLRAVKEMVAWFDQFADTNIALK